MTHVPRDSRLHLQQKAEKDRRRCQKRLASIRAAVRTASEYIGGINNFMGKFHMLDRNRDGSVDHDEFRALCSRLMPNLATVEVEFIIELVDPKGKGYLLDTNFFHFVEDTLHLRVRRHSQGENRKQPATIATTTGLLSNNPLQASATKAASRSSRGTECVLVSASLQLPRSELPRCEFLVAQQASDQRVAQAQVEDSPPLRRPAPCLSLAASAQRQPHPLKCSCMLPAPFIPSRAPWTIHPIGTACASKKP